MPTERLERLAAELISTAEQMRTQRTDAGRGDGRDISESATGSELRALDRAQAPGRWCELATQLYRFRRRRDRLFGSIFGEPAWDILLDLFVMEAKGKRVPVSSSCIASGASHSTAIRQIDELVRCKLVLRERDEHDKRRTYVKLSDEGMRKMALALEQLVDHPELRMSDMLTHPTMLMGAIR